MSPNRFFTQATTLSEQPDWSGITEEICCPLCDYNLHGLSAPRCPECGYTFEWPDLLDPTRRVHPYLFEHHPEKNIRSFWRTLVGAMLPRRFWRSLQPVQPSRPRRLLLYWLLTCLTCIVFVHACLLCFAGVLIYRHLKENPGQRSCVMSSGYQYSTTDPELGIYGEIIDPALKQKFADKYYPDRINRRLLKIVMDELIPVWPKTQLLLLPLLWPWAICGPLLIFRWSMRRAKIRSIHVLRCCVYSAGTLVWVAVAGVAMLAAAVLGPLGFGPVTPMVHRIVEAVSYLSLAAIGLLVVLMYYQLITGYRLYLRLGHPVITALLVHVVVVLVLLTVFSVGHVLLYGYGPLQLYTSAQAPGEYAEASPDSRATMKAPVKAGRE